MHALVHQTVVVYNIMLMSWVWQWQCHVVVTVQGGIWSGVDEPWQHNAGTGDGETTTRDRAGITGWSYWSYEKLWGEDSPGRGMVTASLMACRPISFFQCL